MDLINRVLIAPQYIESASFHVAHVFEDNEDTDNSTSFESS